MFRTGETLDEGCDKHRRDVRRQFADVKVTDRSLIWNSDLVETLELQNLLGQALGARSSRRPTARRAAARMRARTIPSATT